MTAYACDSCRYAVWHANGDGYMCCIAPGMWSISAKRRLVEPCRFYKFDDRPKPMPKPAQLTLFDLMDDSGPF